MVPCLNRRVTSGLAVYEGEVGSTGEKDWLHANSVSYDEKNDQVCVCIGGCV